VSTGLSTLQDPLTFINKLGNSFAESQMFGCKTISQGHVLALHCVMEQASPLTIMQTYHFIEGKLSMRADAMLGRFIDAGGMYNVITRTADAAEIEGISKQGKPVKFSLTWVDAQKESFVRKKDGGIKDNWNAPRIRMQMLWARVASDMVRTLAPHVVCGAYTPEELEDEPAPVPGTIEGEVVPTGTAPAAAAQSNESAKPTRTRKPKEQPAEATESPSTVAPVQTAPEGVARPSEAVTTTSDSQAEVAQQTTGQSPVQLPQIVTDIVHLRDYMSERWPADHKLGDWGSMWAKVKTALRVPESPTDHESFTKADDAVRQKALKWLNDQRIASDKLSTSKDLNTWANQQPGAAQ
jgi:hypothetical protein